MSIQNTVNSRSFFAWAIALSTSLLLACGGGGGGSPPDNSPVFTGTTSQLINVTIHWQANKELRVNQTGGGYNVYISQTSGFDIADIGVTAFNAPWVSGTQAPISQTHTLASGIYYVRVAAYTAFPVANTNSQASTQITVNVPFTLP
ncbi:hypothetical protein MNBD_GAMMA12-2327 [hydrothermal vent metagenome]|uniref:Fibronectin type-III domain-containing protein n=1 Tax=hydrothermal vent metagenome TaxID=652676 RepID=A0A3B0ZE11_9ZZZZ